LADCRGAGKEADQLILGREHSPFEEPAIHSELRTAHCELESAICNLQSAICNLQSAICNLQSAYCKLRTMKKGYWIVDYRSVSDETALREYGALATPAIDAHGGRMLVRSAAADQPREAGLKQRTVVIEYESLAKAVEAYDSAAYQHALKRLGNAAERDFRIVEGV
jgi:uncharacterized protein (DUF1330 family)